VCHALSTRKEDIRLTGKGNSYGARPVEQIISMIKWIQTSRLVNKELSLSGRPSSGVDLISFSDHISGIKRRFSRHKQDLMEGFEAGVPGPQHRLLFSGLGFKVCGS